ncbi:MAG: undecaprenyldiphospho-muramoylpentapeptide beta-N-acetylglucosaminyltransferase [Clostridiales Family XIII bacterium]|jgi:UDP-N-acetylglucosamine--N-acetylmuramyl-(pentapeptide) pyrophosphoryl-undecaprenol N-acetylglucosamine transferase|nr:undecaprenyldiphospho-muramoylpentapeptide beta-N-acetylglucosaminyltransferase [Clostridiales Family XIII bacterium]
MLKGEAMKAILAGGATGGHLYPALAIADKIKRRNEDSEILFVGAEKEVGSDIVSASGYELRTICARGFNRKNLIKNISVVKDLAKCSGQIKRILADFGPDVVIGTGGYVGGPVIREASKKGIPTFIHEQNVLPGVANKMAAKYADEIFVAFDESCAHFPKAKKIMVTGNPVRRGFITAGAMNYREKLGLGDKSMAVLIFGGSQGADRINEIVCDMLIGVDNIRDLDIFFITGRRMYFDVSRQLAEAGVIRRGMVRLIDYTEAIHEYYAASDLIVARSGALTVSEIAVTGRASILIPSPNVTNNHQYYNAKTLSDRGAAIIIKEQALSPYALADELIKLKSNKTMLNAMSQAAAAQGRPGATDAIYDEIVSRIGKT